MIHPNGIDPDVELPKVENMIYKLAWKTATTCPVSFEDAKAEAYYAFVKCCKDYKPERGTKFNTWVYYWVWCDLKTWVTKRARDPLMFVEINDDLTGLAPEERSPSLELVAELSEDAQEIVALILETPGELLNGMPVPLHRLMDKVKKYLVEKRGRCKIRVEQAHLECITHFRTSWAT